jgi:hypothetical protein
MNSDYLRITESKLEMTQKQKEKEVLFWKELRILVYKMIEILTYGRFHKLPPRPSGNYR